MIEQLKSDRWYVDVKGQIKGPLTSYEVINDLMAGHIKVTHRITRNQTHWAAICNEVHFEKAIAIYIQHLSEQSVKQNSAADEGPVDESSGFHNIGNLSKGISDQLNHAQTLQEINVGLNSLRKLQSEMVHNKKMVIEAKREEVEEIHPEDRNIYVDMDTSTKLNIFGKHKLLFVVAIGGLIILVALKYLEYQDKVKAEELKQQVIALQKEKKLEGYEELIDGKKEMTSSEYINLAETEISKNNMSMGTRLLEKALQVAKFGTDKSKAHSLLGYIASESQQLDKAADSYERSLGSSQKLYLSHHNYAILKLKAGELDMAETLLLKALKLEDGPKDKSATLMALIDVAIQLDQKTNKEAEAADAKDEKPSEFNRTDKARVLLERISDSYMREKTIAKLYIEHIKGAKKLSPQLILEFLKHDDDKIKKPEAVAGLDKYLLKWSQLYNWCLPIYNRDRKSIPLNALFSYCVLRGRGAQHALAYAKYSMAKAPHDPIYIKYEQLIQKQLDSDKKDKNSEVR